MSRSLQITGTATAENATPAEGSFRVDPSVKNVRASGDRSNQVQIASPQRPDVVEVPGGAINTTQGEGSAYRSINGQDMITVDGVQMTAGEAKAHGLLDVSQEAPSPGPAKAEDGSQGDEPPVVTAADLGVSAEDWQLHGQDINDLGEALAAGGLDEADGLQRSIDGILNGNGAPEDVSRALAGSFGEEDAETILQAGVVTASEMVDGAMIKAGMDPHDQAAATAVVNMLKGNTSALFEAVTGNPTKLNSLIAGMAKR